MQDNLKIEECSEDDINSIKISEYLKNNQDLVKYIKKLNYFGNKIYFYSVKEESVPGHDCWVNYTGLTSNRPKIIVDFLISKNVLKSSTNILDIGCGLSEIGIEIDRQLDNILYTGLDINHRLLIINKLNFIKNDNYKFIKFDFTNSKEYNILQNNYDIVLACGAETEFNKIFSFVSNNIQPKYIVCETHIGRLKDLKNIIQKCKQNYILIDSNG